MYNTNKHHRHFSRCKKKRLNYGKVKVTSHRKYMSHRHVNDLDIYDVDNALLINYDDVIYITDQWRNVVKTYLPCCTRDKMTNMAESVVCKVSWFNSIKYNFLCNIVFGRWEKYFQVVFYVGIEISRLIIKARLGKADHSSGNLFPT